MNWTILLAALGAVAVAQSIFLGTVNIINGRKGSTANIYLGIMLISLGLRIGKSLVYFYWTDMATLGVAIGGAGLWAVGPSLYLYIKSYLNHSISRGEIALLFLPSFLILLFGSFFFKHIVLDMPMQRWVYLLGSGAMAFSIIASASKFIRSKITDNKAWIILVHSGMLLMAVMFAYQLYSPNIQAYALGALVAAVVLYVINFKGLGVKAMSATVHKNQISPGQLDKICGDLQVAFEEEYIYREQKLTLGKVSERINTPQYLIRRVIQLRHSKNFNDYVNEYRIAEIRDRLEHNTKYTIEAIANEVGFTSNSTFYEAFRKVMACTPAEYRKTISSRKAGPESSSQSFTTSQPA